MWWFSPFVHARLCFANMSCSNLKVAKPKVGLIIYSMNFCIHVFFNQNWRIAVRGRSCAGLMWTYTHFRLLWHCRLHRNSSESWSEDFVHQGRGRTFQLQTILRVTSYITSGPPCGVIVVFLNKSGSSSIAERSTLSIFWKSLLSNVYLCLYLLNLPWHSDSEQSGVHFRKIPYHVVDGMMYLLSWFIFLVCAF